MPANEHLFLVNHTFEVKKIVLAFLSFSAFLLCSCSKGSYLSVIPDDVLAIMAIDAPHSGMKIDAEGIDTSEKIYLFETADGTFCLAAKCNNSSDGFSILQDKWVCGYADGKMLIMGPVIPAQQDEVKKRIGKMLQLDEEESIVGTPLMERLDSVQSPVALVAQSAALPEQFAPYFTLGAPRQASTSQIYVAASIALSDGVMQIAGYNFSLNKSIGNTIAENIKTFRPVKGAFDKEASRQFFSLMMNVEGGKLLPLLQQNSALQALLAGINTAIDMDNILCAVDGDMAFMADSTLANLEMKAQLKNRDFLKDIGYWKSSCPAGTRITDQGRDTWLFQGSDLSFLFGVTADNQFFGRLTRKQPADAGQVVSSVLDMIQPFTGPLRSIVYKVKNEE